MKRNIVIATVAAAALIGGGTATAFAVGGDDDGAARNSSVQLKDHDRHDDGRDDDGKNGDRSDRDDAAENSAEAKAAKVTAPDAIKAALAHTKGTAVSAELDDEDGGLVWDVDVLDGKTWHSVEVDPGTGKVLGSWVDKSDKSDAKEDAAEAARVNSALKGASTSAADAARAAADKGTVTSVDLDDDGKAGAWDVETTGPKGTESDWHVSLTDGKVTADHADAQDDDHDDDSGDSDD